MTPKIPSNILKTIESVKGFLDHDEGMKLYELALDAAEKGPCLEVGTYCGKSACYIGAACKAKNSILFTVDHHRGSEEQQPGQQYFDKELIDKETGRIDTLRFFRKTCEQASLEETVVPLVCGSKTAGRFWTTDLSLVFIDGGHALETVICDVRLWAPHIMKGGFLILHDVFEDPLLGGIAPYQAFKIEAGCGLYSRSYIFKSLGILLKSV